MIKGIGIDIIEVKRVRRLARDKKFLKKIYTDEEIGYCRSRKKSWEHYAVRFAAKEAVWKALGDKALPLKDISVINNPDGKPEVYIGGRRVSGSVFISLTHTSDYAAAFCIAMQKSG